MLFNSGAYLVFLPSVLLVYWLVVPARLRPAFLLFASYIFYAYWRRQYLLLILLMTVWNYFAGLWLARVRTGRRWWLALTVAGNLATLGVFKYANLALSTLYEIFAPFGSVQQDRLLNIILPLGISFFTFEFIHYVVDVYRGHPPVKNPLVFALFPAFFPTQIAGPIKRYQDFTAQVYARPRFNMTLFRDGLELVILGLFKKVAIADHLSGTADLAFSHASGLSAVDAWAGMLAFTFQLYFDFSGYTDIGRGSAQMLGFRVPENFRMPYLAPNLQEFWRRWHITLSNWLRDYLYIPLGGNRQGGFRTQLNMFITMVLGGLWHGAAWHFAVWGAYHGGGLAGLRSWRPVVKPLGRALRSPLVLRVLAVTGVLATFLTVALGWVLFRAADLGGALTIYRHLLPGTPSAGGFELSAGMRRGVIGVTAGTFAVELAVTWLRSVHAHPLAQTLSPLREWARPIAWAALASIVLLLGGGAAQRFLYFQF